MRRLRNPSQGADMLLLAGIGFLLYKLLPKAQAATFVPASCPSLEQMMGVSDPTDPCQAGNAAMTTSIPTGSLPPPIPVSDAVTAISSGVGRVYMSGMGMIGEGYNINETFGGDASAYELAQKFHL